MKIRVVKAVELDRSHEVIWEEMREQNPDLASPYFAVEFTKQVAAAYGRAFVGVIEAEQKTIGYFPFQKNCVGTGVPIGGGLSDYHGIISAGAFEYSLFDIVQQTGLKAWEFDHLIASQHPSAQEPCFSPGICLSHGFEHYAQSLKDKGSELISTTLRKRRKIEKEVGSLRFQFHTDDRRVLQKLMEWKSSQCIQTGCTDFFSYPWTRELIERIFTTRTAHFKGVLSALYAGDHLIAAHFGMQSKKHLHWWFPVYNEVFSQYSPGISLLLNVLEHAESQGIRTIDLGKGEEHYKNRVMNVQTAITEGAIVTSPFSSFMRNVGHKLRCADKKDRFKSLPGRALRKWDRFIKFR